MDDNYPKFYREGMVRARKEHECCECLSIIPRGETYHIFTGLWDDFGTWKTCFHCNDLRDDINKTLKRGEYLSFGGLSDYIYYHDREDFSKRYVDILYKRGIVIPNWLVNKMATENKKAVLHIANALNGC